MTRKYKIASLFSGCGGLDLGFIKSGYEVVWANDFFKEAGSKDKQMKIYGGLFHEILNEYCKDEVIGDMIRWMEVRI